jgi:hypothetical protein
VKRDAQTGFRRCLICLACRSAGRCRARRAIINNAGAPQINGAKVTIHDDARVQGGKALRVDVPAKGKNVWDSAVESAVTKPVQAGDRLVLAFYARLEKGENGTTSVTLPFAGVQLAAEPYTPLFNQAVELGPEWKLVQVSGAAGKPYAPGTLKAAVHLATGKQVIDFGPVAVLDLGKAK